MSFWVKLGQLDRRVLYWAMFLLLIVPYISPLGLPIPITEGTVALYEFIEKNISEEDVVVFNISAGVSAWPEVLPGMIAIMRHLVQKGAKIVVWGVGHMDIPITWEKIKSETPGLAKYKYGEDYVFIGFIAGTETAIAQLAVDVHAVVKADYYGTPIAQLPLMQRVKSAKDVSLVITTDTGDAPLWYVRHWYMPYKVPIGENGIAMMGSEYMPFYKAGQFVGILIGVRGGAEYERLLGYLGMGATACDALNVSHLLVIFAIILANIGMVAMKLTKQEVK